MALPDSLSSLLRKPSAPGLCANSLLVCSAQEAAGAASVVFAFNGVLATFLVAWPPFRHLLCSLAGMPLV